MLANILLFAAVGFIAQLIDGALGMAYGVSSTTFLLTVGVAPAVASACVHASEVATTAVSGLAHFRLGNIDKQLFARLVIPGVLGGIAGAYLLNLEALGAFLKPFISLYLIIMGLVILSRALRKAPEREITRETARARALIPLGAAGGFFDALGGGGWGPVVTTTVIARGHSPRLTIGSVNASEFFVTFAQAITFVLTIPDLLADHWPIIVGLLSGGVLAAPLAAYVCRRVNPRAMMIIVGCVIIALSLRTLILAW